MLGTFRICQSCLEFAEEQIVSMGRGNAIKSVQKGKSVLFPSLGEALQGVSYLVLLSLQREHSTIKSMWAKIHYDFRRV